MIARAQQPPKSRPPLAVRLGANVDFDMHRPQMVLHRMSRSPGTPCPGCGANVTRAGRCAYCGNDR